MVGVGPGDPELLTMAAIRAIEAAAVVAYPVARLEAEGMALQFCLAQSSPLAMESPELSAAVDALQLDPHVQEWQTDGASRRVGQHLTPAQGLQILNLVDLGLHEHERLHPAASFRAIHFETDPNASEQQQQARWREWLRQSNLFQFLPHLLISTPGWSGSEQSPAVDPPQVWVSGSLDSAEAADPSAQEAAGVEQQRAWKELCRTAPQQALPLMEALAALWQGTNLPVAEQAFELEGLRGEVVAQAELAWPEQQLAVVIDPADGEAFSATGWRCWSLEDPPGTTATTLREVLTSP